MEIYAIFNSDTNVYQCALKQGAEPEGQFDVRGDERWLASTSQLNNLFDTPHVDDDWVLIDEDDFQKYMLGRSGGDNGMGYIRDPETNHAVSAPARVYSFDEQIAQIQSKYGSKLNELNESYVNASLADMDTTNLKKQYTALIEQSNAEFMQVIEAVTENGE